MPSRTYSGSMLPLIEELPRMRMARLPSGVRVTITPGTLASRVFSIGSLPARSSSSPVTVVPGAEAGGASGAAIGVGASAVLSVSEGRTGMLVAQAGISPRNKALKTTRGVDDAIRQWRKARRAVNKIVALRMPAIVFLLFIAGGVGRFSADAGNR